MKTQEANTVKVLIFYIHCFPLIFKSLLLRCAAMEMRQEKLLLVLVTKQGMGWGFTFPHCLIWRIQTWFLPIANTGCYCVAPSQFSSANPNLEDRNPAQWMKENPERGRWGAKNPKNPRIKNQRGWEGKRKRRKWIVAEELHLPLCLMKIRNPLICRWGTRLLHLSS